jgi:hypothetical protein
MHNLKTMLVPPKIGQLFTLSGYLNGIRIDNELIVVTHVKTSRSNDLTSGFDFVTFVTYFVPSLNKVSVSTLYLFNLSTKTV